MQAQRLDDVGAALLEGAGHRLEGVGCEERSGVAELLDVLIAAVDLLGRHFAHRGVFLEHRRADLLAAVVLEQADHVIGELVDRVDRAGAHVQHDVEAV